jgi:hypothetical protein
MDNKLLSNSINNVMVDIGKNKDWSITDYEQMRQTTIDGKEYLTQINNMCWVRCRQCSDYEAQGASGNYKAWGASGNYKARGASGRKYEA